LGRAEDQRGNGEDETTLTNLKMYQVEN
jgi:hypothetical protein